MKNLIVAVAALAAISTAALAQKPAPKSAEPKQTTCAVTGEKLGGEMGKPIPVAYTGKDAKFKGKSVMVCCGGCTGKVKSNPDKYFQAVYAPKAPAKPKM